MELNCKRGFRSNLRGERKWNSTASESSGAIRELKEVGLNGNREHRSDPNGERQCDSTASEGSGAIREVKESGIQLQATAQEQSER